MSVWIWVFIAFVVGASFGATIMSAALKMGRWQ